MRLRSEQVVLKPGLSRNAEQLIKMSQEEVPITVTDVEDAVSRLRALLVAFDYLGVLAFSPFVSAGTPQVRGGSIEYLKLMEQKRNKTPGLAFVVMSDRLIREKVYELTTERKTAFPSFSFAMENVSNNLEPLWAEGSAECLNCARSSVSSSHTESRDKTAVPDINAENRELIIRNRQLENEIKNLRTAGKQQRSKEGNLKERHTLSRREDRSRTPVGRQSPLRKQIPAAEWRAIGAVKPQAGVSKDCRFWNSSSGCSDESCRLKHACCLCVGDHRYIDKHFKENH